MATLITSPILPPVEAFDESVCTSTYSDFENSRIALPFNESERDQLEVEKNWFKEKVVTPLFASAQKIVIARHFTVSVAELKALMAITPDADYIQFHNTLNAQNVNYLYAVPASSSRTQGESEIFDNTTLLVASFPCPPDPRCPTFILI